MRSLSLGLIKGQINEVEQKINVAWVQPKVLNLDQIKGMELAMDEWSQK